MNEILEKTRVNLETNQKRLSPIQMFNLREKIIETKNLLEMQEGLKLFEKKAKNRIDADSVRLFHNMKAQYQQIKRKFESTGREMQASALNMGRNDSDNLMPGTRELKNISDNILTEDQKYWATPTNRDQHIPAKNNYSMYASHIRFVQN